MGLCVSTKDPEPAAQERAQSKIPLDKGHAHKSSSHKGLEPSKGSTSATGKRASLGASGSIKKPAEATVDTPGLDDGPEKDADPETKEDGLVSKLLLLGAGDSGKSTIFRQIKALYGEAYTTEQRKSFKAVIDSNIIGAMKMIVKMSDILDPQFGTKVSDAALVSKKFIETLDEDMKVDESVAQHVSTLWADPGIRLTFSKNALYQLPTESVEYFFQRVDVISQPGYIPSFQDVLRCRARTTGIQQIKFSLGRHKFVIIDVGGQRNERKKWKKSFQGVTAVIFVAAMSEYDQQLFEDSKVNRMNEALHLFGEICASHWFKDRAIILFLNKSDIFAEKIKTVDLKCCFPEYEGGCDYYAAAEYIDTKFRDKSKGRSRDIYSHVTTATDTDNIQQVFDDVKDIVIKESLKEGGLL